MMKLKTFDLPRNSSEDDSETMQRPIPWKVREPTSCGEVLVAVFIDFNFKNENAVHFFNSKYAKF